MPGPWDSTMKRLVGEIPQDLVTWLLHGAHFVQEAPSHLKNRNIDADLLYHILVEDRPYMFHVEFQRSRDPLMAERLWEYNVLASLAHKLPVHSFLIYLKEDKTKKDKAKRVKTKQFIESPFIQWSAFGEEIHHFTFKVIKMWEIPTDVLLYSGSKGLLPLVPLTREGLQHEAMEQAITQLTQAEEQSDVELLAALYSLGSLAYNEGVDLIWFQRRFALVDDILKDSWLYKEWEQRVEQGIQQTRQLDIVALVQNRFSSLTALAQERVALLKEPEQLQALLIQIAQAQTEQDARRYLLEAEDTQKH